MKLGVILSSVMDVTQFAGELTPREIGVEGKIVKARAGTVAGKEVLFINRSSTLNMAPHNVDYVANMAALRSAGITHVISSAVAGSLKPGIEEGDLVLLDQFIDFTRRSQFSRFAEGDFAFVDMTDPYCSFLRGLFLDAAHALDTPVHSTGCYVGVDGPRFETRAEIKMFGLLGGDVIGMTNVQETVVAREFGLHFSTLAYVSNMGAGLQSKHVSRQDNAASVSKNALVIQDLFREVISRFAQSEKHEGHALPEIEIIKQKNNA